MKEWIIFGILESLSVLTLICMWRRKDSGILRKLLWTPVVLIPFAGPLFYMAMYKPLKKSGYRKNWPDDRGGMPPGGQTAVFR